MEEGTHDELIKLEIIKKKMRYPFSGKGAAASAGTPNESVHEPHGDSGESVGELGEGLEEVTVQGVYRELWETAMRSEVDSECER